MSALLDSNSILDALRALYRPPAAKKPRSTAIISRKLGYSSPRFLEMILKGDRSPSLDFLARTGDYFSLSDAERGFLELLAQKEKLRARGRPVGEVERRIQGLKRKMVSVKFIEPHFFTLFSDWYCLVIKQLLQNSDQGHTVEELVRKLKGKVTAPEAEKALHALIHLGLASRSDDRFVSLSRDSMYTRPDLPSTAVRKHHRQMMERAIEALEEQGVSEREMISLTFSCAPESLPKLKEALRRFRDEVDAEFSRPGGQIYQLNLQLFSHTR